MYVPDSFMNRDNLKYPHVIVTRNEEIRKSDFNVDNEIVLIMLQNCFKTIIGQKYLTKIIVRQ